jgi:hypothetical protein
MTTAARTIDETYSRVHVKGTENPKANGGVAEIVTTMWSKAKDVADAFGIGSKAADLLGKCAPDSVTPWTAHVKKSMGVARGAMSFFYWPITIRNAWKSQSLRDWVEVTKIGGFTAAAAVPYAATSDKILSWTGIPGIVLDCFDLSREVELNKACTDLTGQAVSAEARKIINHQMWTSTCKILKLCLTLFAGIAVTGAWLFGCALPVALATAALVASLGGLILGFTISYADTNAEWTAKVTVKPEPKDVVAV